MLSLVPSDVDLQGLGASEAGMLPHQQRVASRQSPTPQAYNLSGTPTGSGQNLSGTPSSGSGGSPPPQPPPTSISPGTLLSPTTPTLQMTLQLPQGPSPTPALQHPQPRPAGYEVPHLPTQPASFPWPTPHVQMCMCWDDHHGVLYSGSTAGMLHSWSVQSREEQSCLHGHTECARALVA